MQLTEIYHQIKALPNYKPTKKTNQLFECLVQVALNSKMATGLTHKQIAQLQTICATAEYELEKHWANKIIKSHSPRQYLSKFPYYQNYLDLTKLEWSAFQGCTHHHKHRVIFIGSGPLPLTAIILARDYNCQIALLDIDPQAIEISRKLISALKLSQQFKFYTSDAKTFAKYAHYNVIYVAALAGVDNKQKELIFSTISAQASQNCHILARSSWGQRKLLYRPLTLTDSNIVPIIEVRPYNHIVNSFYVLKPAV